MTVSMRATVHCDLCPQHRYVWSPSATGARDHLKQNDGWRRDKLGRDICPAHPKLKGSR